VTTDCGTNATPTVCNQAIGRCVALTSQDCQVVYSTQPNTWQNNDAIILGSILSMSGTDMSTGVSDANSAQLAIDDFTQTVVGLPGGADGKPRPLVLVECDDTGDPTVATRAATHLVNDVGVPAILGPETSGLTTAVINSVTIPDKTLDVSPSATSATLSGVSQYFWRTAPSDNIQAIPARLSVGEIATAHSLSPIKLGILYKSDSYGMGLYNTVIASLMINGALATDTMVNSANFKPIQYLADGSDIVNQAKTMAAFAPNLIALFGTNEVISMGLDTIEANWPTGTTPPPLPQYLISDGGEVNELLAEVMTNPGVRTRIRGTVPGTDNPLFQAFSSEYQGKYGMPAEVFGMAGSYDIIYLLAYAMTSVPSGMPLNGTTASNGMSKLVGGTPINVGTAQMQMALSTLSGGNPIAINGASGPLKFDLMQHEAPSDIEIWCVTLNSSNQPQFSPSGRSYDATMGAMTGTFSCP
jgi:branched-chain amino acid transport system substrate-binding protein